MQPRKKKPFIDKKNSITFHLVHRSQKDPLAADETAPQHVLLEAQPLNSNKVKSHTFVFLSFSSKTSPSSFQRFEEQHKYGVYFDDDYDYLQHLRVPEPEDLVWESVENPNALKGKERMDTNPLQLPSSVFASTVEEDVGLLNKAAPSSGPRPDWDPDVVAAMDDDFNFDDPDNELEDNFIELAGGSGGGGGGGPMDVLDEDDEEGEWDSDFSGDDEDEGEERDLVRELRNMKRFDNEETKSRFTEYSMSSSVIRRNEQLTLLDDRFEKFFERYDEPEIGALDCEEIEGDVDVTNEMILQMAEQFRREKEEALNEYSKKWDAERIREYMEGESDDEMEELEVDGDENAEERRKKKWDCESILSTYSNLYNHPKVIEEAVKRRAAAQISGRIQLNPRTGIPLDTLDGDTNTLTASKLAKLNADGGGGGMGGGGVAKSLCAQSVISTLSVLSLRPKDETPEERRERKKMLKEYRSERRFEKKANTMAFKEEGKKQVKIKINQNNNRGSTIV